MRVDESQSAPKQLPIFDQMHDLIVPGNGRKRKLAENSQRVGTVREITDGQLPHHNLVHQDFP